MRRIRSVLGSVALGAALTLSIAPTARADIYRYVDKDGVEHYTNIQPSSRGWQRIIRTPSTAPRARSTGGRSVVRAPDPERLRRYDAYIREAAFIYRLPEAFVRAVMRVESNFYPEAVSQRGAMGLMQLMPGTAAAMGVLNAFDPRQNVLGGARFLRVLANSFGGDLVRTIAAYNAGPGAVERYKGIPPYAETRRYVQRVLTHYYEYRELELRGTKLATR